MLKKTRTKTISDFNDQWKTINKLNDDYMDSKEMLIDYFPSFFKLEEINNKIIAEVGSGNGRVLRTLLSFNPKKIFAIEPSSNGYAIISNSLKKYSNLKIIHTDGAQFKTEEKCDFIFSIGVIHHIKEPIDVLINIKENLKPKGKVIIWVYGYENNIFYIFIYKILSSITKKMPNFFLYWLSSILNILIQPYIFLCKYLNLPLKNYLIKVFSKCGWSKRKDIIFDQLNPAYAKYYKKEEIEKELISAGFVNLKFYHRHGYSWTILGEKT